MMWPTLWKYAPIANINNFRILILALHTITRNILKLFLMILDMNLLEHFLYIENTFWSANVMLIPLFIILRT